ncbi:MAG TPA: peptide chain release factor N(5)-glutamine methyltransferase [Acidimicrobiia bacterium]|nr:peptide chain release factor N(5)-glutamine methyltransferase [Acidimicrobiia bacterium]
MTSTWRELRAHAAEQLADAGVIPAQAEARFMVERASGYDADEWPDAAEVRPPARAVARLHEMVARRVAGEPLQYVLGAWSFRGLDLMLDRRVLIPRPETELVVEVALEEAVRMGLRRSRRGVALVDAAPRAVLADLGTGSGAIALALEAELPDVEVWASDVSEDALAVARANVAGCAATRVRLATAASWFDGLPASLRGALLLVVANPPYVAEHEVAALPDDVRLYEPRTALVAGPRGTEAIETLLEEARAWLAPGGTLVLELAPHQGDDMRRDALELGYREVLVRDDLTARPRELVARTG